MNYIAVRGSGNPNDADGEYKTALELLYGIAYTLKMSHKGSHRIDGYFEYVVPPLEGLFREELPLFRFWCFLAEIQSVEFYSANSLSFQKMSIYLHRT